MQRTRVIWTFLGSVVAVALGAMTAAVAYFHVDNTGNDLQRSIVRLQERMEESVSSCLDAERASAYVSSQESQVVKRVLVNVAMARYENSQVMLAHDGPVVAALRTAYPGNNAAWNTLTDVTVGCRQAAESTRQMLDAAVATFDAWRREGDVFGIRNNFPTQELKAIDPQTGQLVRGHGALEALSFVISDKGVGSAGLMPAQSLLRVR